MRASQQTAKAAGRGLLWISSAKIYFILAGYTVQLALPRLLGSAAAFGLYSTAMSQVSILNNVLIAATIQSVSKHVSEDQEQAAVRLRQALWLQLVVGSVLAGLLFLAAPTIAQSVLDDELAPLLRIASAVVFGYAVYAALVGSLNGRQLFDRQARLDMLFTTLRTAGIVGCAALGLGATGAISGFSAASVTLLGISLALVGTGARGQRLPWRHWLAFMGPLWIYQGFLNGTLQIDLSVLKRTVAELALAAGAGAELAKHQASTYAGYYKAAQTFALVPYQLILSVTFIVFPMVSRSVSMGDHAAAAGYIRAAMRFSLLVLLAVAAPIAGAARGVLLIAYEPDYLAGSDALMVLVFGMVMFALFVVAATALTGSGSPRAAAGIAGGALVVVIVSARTLVQWVGVGPHTLLAAALGTAMGTGFALVASAAAIFARFGTFVPVATAARALAAAAVGFGVAHWVPHAGRLGALAALVAGGLSYLTCLLLLREIEPHEVRTIVQTLRKRRASTPGGVPPVDSPGPVN